MAGELPDEDLLEFGRERPAPAWLAEMRRVPDRLARARYGGRILAALAVLVAIAVYVVSRPPGQVTPDGAPTLQQRQVADEGATSFVLAEAAQPGPLANYVRSSSGRGQCPLVPIGHSPQAAIEAAVRVALPAYSVRDVGRVLDEFTALCTLELRAADAAGSTLVLEVVAPQPGARQKPFTAVTIGANSSGARTVAAASATTPAGWSVRVGTVGPVSDQPAAQTLLDLAQSTAMHW